MRITKRDIHFFLGLAGALLMMVLRRATVILWIVAMALSGALSSHVLYSLYKCNAFWNESCSIVAVPSTLETTYSNDTYDTFEVLRSGQHKKK